MSTETAGGDKLFVLASAQPCRHFSLLEIQSATNDFDDKLVIGKGGFGKVYRGHMYIEKTTQEVAIKRQDSMSSQGEIEFRAEIHMLSKLRHCHLVSLIGFCDDNKEMILVYEYMPRGTLNDHLHKAETPLNWFQRLKIAIGAARGLDYLHSGVGTQHGVIHRDVKTSNILLDENWEAMISDFGLSKISSTNQSSSYIDASLKGTFGYLDPEYYFTGKLTRKTDVYAFRVVLFELLSGRLAVDERNAEEQYSLVRWAQKCVKERKLDQMVDSNIKGMAFPKCLRGFAQIADRCLRSVLKERPTMAEVVDSLQALQELQQRHDNSSPEPAGITRFTWKIHNYLLTTKQIADQNCTRSSKSPEVNQCSSEQGEMPRQHEESVFKNLKSFTFYELRLATKNFHKDTCLSDKSFVKVNKGWIDKSTFLPSEDNTGLPIVIKRLDELAHSLDLEMLIKEFSHPNLDKLIGYCLEGTQVFLVYEFMPNGNFKHLLDSGGLARLPLVTKVKIAVGIARGIVFLKNKTQDQVNESLLHRHNILLDEDFTAKLSDYDVTKLVHGHYPQYTLCWDELDNCDDYIPGRGPFRPQNNLFGFTVVFVEMLTGRHIYTLDQFKLMSRLVIRDGSMDHIASLCFEFCNVVDLESKILRILEKYFPASKNLLTTETSETCL